MSGSCLRTDELRLNSNLITRIAPLLFLFMWSSGAIFVKAGLQYSSVITFLFLRAAGSFVLIFIIGVMFFKSDAKRLLNIDKQAVIKLCTTGVLLQVMYQGFYFLAIANGLSPGMMAITLGLQPLITPVFARERITGGGWLILMAAFMGLLIAIIGGGEDGTVTVLGALSDCSLYSLLPSGQFSKSKLKHPLSHRHSYNIRCLRSCFRF